MKFTIEITEYNNAAFCGGDFYCNANDETARILRRIADRLNAGETEGACMDICGNKVGTWGFTDCKEDDGIKQTNFYQVFRIDYQGQQIVSCGNGNVIYSNIEAADAAARREWQEKRDGFGMGMVKSTRSEEGAYQIVTHIGTEFNWEVREANLMED